MGHLIIPGIVEPLTAPSSLPPVGTALEEFTWAQIRAISDDDQAANYFSVGDTKAVKVSGTIGTLSVNATYYVYIIGIDHNKSVEGKGITFGTFKTAASGGKNVALCDGGYNSNSSTLGNAGTKYFRQYHWNSSVGIYGGWKGFDFRYDILGSTDVPPSGYGKQTVSGRVGYDASETCAINPVANTLMAALPSELREVMKPMTIYTNNGNAADNTAASVTASVDYLPLLAEFEITGSRSVANVYEQNYQEQYAYYSAGNSKVKYKHDATATAVLWWIRSLYSGNSSYPLGIVNDGGSMNMYYEGFDAGVAPIFRV